MTRVRAHRRGSAAPTRANRSASREGDAKRKRREGDATRADRHVDSRSTRGHVGWGGARAGAGRPAKGAISSERHQTRPTHAAHHPVHITSRITHAIGSVQRGRVYTALRRALTLSFARSDFRIVHLAVRPTCIDLIVEAADKTALARGMQGFQVSAARWLNRAARRHGNVFVDRYRMLTLRTRIDVRDAVGRLPLLRQTTWPQTWLLRVEAAPSAARHWFRTRADEDS